MTKRHLIILFLANQITELGSAFVFIPLGNYLSPLLGIGGAYSFLLVLRKLPSVLLANRYGYIANRFGISRAILGAQAAAAFFVFLGCLALASANFSLFLLCITATAVCAGSLNCLFPAFLQQLTTSARHLERSFSGWYFVQHLALLLATVLGAYLESRVSTLQIVFIDGLTFLVAALLWFFFTSGSSKKEQCAVSVVPSLRTIYASLSRVAQRLYALSFLRSVLYGFVNPLLPVLVLASFHESSMSLAWLYCILGLGALVGSSLSHTFVMRSTTYVFSNALEIVLLCFALLSGHWVSMFVFLALTVAPMAINEIKLQTFFFLAQGKDRSIESNTTFEQGKNMGALIGYAVYNVVPHRFSGLGVVVLAVFSCALLMCLRKESVTS